MSVSLSPISNLLLRPSRFLSLLPPSLIYRYLFVSTVILKLLKLNFLFLLKFSFTIMFEILFFFLVLNIICYYPSLIDWTLKVIPSFPDLEHCTIVVLLIQWRNGKVYVCVLYIFCWICRLYMVLRPLNLLDVPFQVAFFLISH